MDGGKGEEEEDLTEEWREERRGEGVLLTRVKDLPLIQQQQQQQPDRHAAQGKGEGEGEGGGLL